MNTHTTQIFCTNMHPSGCAFGLLSDGTQAYIPKSIVEAVSLNVGDLAEALLVPNHSEKRGRTEWFTVRINQVLDAAAPVAATPVAVTPVADAPAAIRELLRAGGAWTTGKMFRHFYPGAARADNISAYNTVNHTLRTMFANGECVKLSLWATADQTKPSIEWFAVSQAEIFEALGGK